MSFPANSTVARATPAFMFDVYVGTGVRLSPGAEIVAVQGVRGAPVYTVDAGHEIAMSGTASPMMISADAVAVFTFALPAHVTVSVYCPTSTGTAPLPV